MVPHLRPADARNVERMRIITGRAKGRRLAAPDTDTTRPATDRVREAVFSAIGPWVEDADVLDLYAGSGSYGLEALSRGAATAVFVERGKAALDALRANIATVDLGGTMVATEVGSFLRAPGTRTFHLVFIDPPWDLETSAVDDQLVLVDRILEPDGEVVVSRREGDVPPSPPPGWRVATDRRYGDARIYRYVKASDEDE
jgi:16S rRNA (guanine966-N2)-methyltransferase